MSISSNATGLRPGVCTSTTRPTNPYTGQIIYETDTGYLRVWDGSAWDYLSQKQDDTVGLGPVGGLVYITSSTFSTATQVLVDNCFTSTFRDYRVHFETTAYSANNTVQIQMRTGGSSGSNYTSLNYQFQLLEASNTTTLASQAVGNDWWRLTYGYSTGHISGVMDFFSPYESVNTQYQSTGRSNSGSTTMLQNHCSGYMAATTSFTGIRIYSSSNMTGRIIIYGYRTA